MHLFVKNDHQGRPAAIIVRPASSIVDYVVPLSPQERTNGAARRRLAKVQAAIAEGTMEVLGLRRA